MINFREIFNARYGIFFIILIFVLFFLLLIVNRDIKDSFRVVSKILFASGIFSIVLVVLFNICISMFVGNVYRMFVSVISDSLCNNLLYRGIVNIILGGILWGIYYLISKRENVKYS